MKENKRTQAIPESILVKIQAKIVEAAELVQPYLLAFTPLDLNNIRKAEIIAKAKGQTRRSVFAKKNKHFQTDELVTIPENILAQAQEKIVEAADLLQPYLPPLN